ncbi:MAG: hypothetical protein KDB22_25825 [Planctomycetales bacterium]|nr:hypothetical protein [Planctomycetales bacterium]
MLNARALQSRSAERVGPGLSSPSAAFENDDILSIPQVNPLIIQSGNLAVPHNPQFVRIARNGGRSA